MDVILGLNREYAAVYLDGIVIMLKTSGNTLQRVLESIH